MAEADRAAVADARLDFLVDAAERLVGGEEHDDVGRAQRLPRPARPRGPASSAVARAAGRPAEPDDDVDPAVLEVERLRPALVAVAEDGDALARRAASMSMSLSRSSSMAVRLGLRSEQRQRVRRALASSSGSRKRGQSSRRLMREPGVLPLGVAPRRLLAGGDRSARVTSPLSQAAISRTPIARITGKSRVEPACRAAPAPRPPRLARPSARSARRSGGRASRAVAAGSAACSSISLGDPAFALLLPFARASCPVDSTTSSARAMRVVSAGLSRAGRFRVELRQLRRDSRRPAPRGPCAARRDRWPGPARSRRASVRR